MKDFIITSNGNLINYHGKNACNATITSHYIIITLYIKNDTDSTTSHSVHRARMMWLNSKCITKYNFFAKL